MTAENQEKINRARAEIMRQLVGEIPADVLGVVLAEIHQIQFSAWENGWDAGRASGLEYGALTAYKEGHRAGWDAARAADDARRAADEMPIKPME